MEGVIGYKGLGLIRESDRDYKGVIDGMEGVMSYKRLGLVIQSDRDYKGMNRRNGGSNELKGTETD